MLDTPPHPVNPNALPILATGVRGFLPKTSSLHRPPLLPPVRIGGG
jgi:hypothetical protein